MNLAPSAALDAAPALDGWRSALVGARRWRRRLAARWRRPGLLPVAAGCLALAAAAVLSLLLVPRWQADSHAAAQALHQRARSARPAAPPPPPVASPAQRLHAALPAADQTPQRVAALLALARRHDIVVRSARQAIATGGDGGPGWAAGAQPGSTTATPNTATPPATAGASTRPLPVSAAALAWRAQGRYADLRAFVAEALQADTGLVLDQLRLSRADARVELLDADLQWQLLQQAEAPARSPR